MKLRCLLLFCVTVGSAFAQAQKPAPADSPLPANVTVQIDWIQLPHLTANQLIRQHLKHTREGDALYNAAKELVAQKKAERLDFSSFVVRGGQRAKTESILEKPYPTWFDVPRSVSQRVEKGQGVNPPSPALPNSFAYRFLGRSAEVEATVSEDRHTIDLNLFVEWNEHLADIPWGTGLNEVKPPAFGAGKFAVQLLEDSGAWQLAGLLTPPQTPPEGKLPGMVLPAERVLVFVRATAGTKKPAAAPMPTDVKQVTVLTEWIETDAAVAADLMGKFAASADTPELREALEPLLNDGRAALVETSAVQVRGGQRSKVESITEYPYPFEFDPPEAPQGFGGGGSGIPPHVTPLYDVFNTKNLGTTVEAEVTVSATGEMMDMNIAPELVFNAGTDSFGQAPSAVKQQRFQTMKTTCQVLLKTGVPSMISSFDAPLLVGKALPAVRARKVLLFVRAIP